MEPHENRFDRVRRADQNREVLGAAVARAKRDEAGVLGAGERDSRIGDPGEAGHRSAPAQHRLGIDRGEIGAPAGQRRLGRSERQDQHGRQEGGEPGERHRGELAAFGNGRLRAEPGRFDAERGGRIGEVADHRGGQIWRKSERYRTRERPRGRFAPGKSKRDRTAPGQHHAQLAVRHRAQAHEVVVVDKLGGEDKRGVARSGEQHRFAAAQRHDRNVERAPRGAAPGHRCDQPFNHKPHLLLAAV
jgi:hypothetical protein